MADTTRCNVVRDPDGGYRLSRTTSPNPGATVARIRPVFDRRSTVTHWQLVPLVTMHGANSRKWASAAEAIAATRLMTAARARRAVAAADAEVGACAS